MSEVLIPITMFLVIFGIFYVYYNTRNKERIALIEKGADASIFNQNNSGKSTVRLLLNLGLLLIGIGLGILMAYILDEFLGFSEDAAYPSMIFIFAGFALLLGFNQTKKMVKENQ